MKSELAPFEAMEQDMTRMMERIWPLETTGLRIPQCEVTEAKDTITARVELPGAEKKDIELHVEPTFIEVKVDKEKEMEKKGEYKYEARHFYRRIPLPVQVHTDKVKAKYENGVLLVTANKKETLPGKRKVLIE